jgi:chromosome segregation ATPase
MELERDQLKKNLFGGYPAEDVDRLLNKAELLLRQKDEEQAAAEARVKEELADTRRIAAELKELQLDTARLQEENERLTERNLMLSEECRTREKEVHSLRMELDDLNVKMGEFQTELDLAKSQAAVLGSRVARQRRELEEKDQLLLADPVGEANKRAQQIIESATAMSQKMIDDAESMRSRALASVRASYFNAMGFRQELENRYFNLQNDLDQSLRTLRGIEAEGDLQDPDNAVEKW